MIYFVEFRIFDEPTALVVRERLFAVAERGRWVEWNKDLIDICSRPDVTLLDASICGDWIDEAKRANAARGRQVVCVGLGRSTIGLHTLPSDFFAEDLAALTALGLENGYRRIETYSPRYKPTMPSELR